MYTETPQIPQTIVTKHTSDINATTNGDCETCSIKDVLKLPDKRLVLSDPINQKIKMIDSNGRKVVNELELSSIPWAVTRYENDIAVTMPLAKRVALLHVHKFRKFPLIFQGAVLQIRRTIEVSGDCRGIAAVGDILVVSFKNPPKIEMIDKQGSLVKCLVTERLGRQLFECPDHLAVSMDQATLYVSDAEKDTVTSISMDGDVHAIFRNADLDYACSICVGHNGFVYVCNNLSNNIRVLTPDCKGNEILLNENDGLDCPTSICYCGETNRLYVGLENGIIKVFKLSSTDTKIDRVDKRIQRSR